MPWACAQECQIINLKKKHVLSKTDRRTHVPPVFYNYHCPANTNVRKGLSNVWGQPEWCHSTYLHIRSSMALKERIQLIFPSSLKARICCHNVVILLKLACYFREWDMPLTLYTQSTVLPFWDVSETFPGAGLIIINGLSCCQKYKLQVYNAMTTASLHNLSCWYSPIRFSWKCLWQLANCQFPWTLHPCTAACLLLSSLSRHTLAAATFSFDSLKDCWMWSNMARTI